MVVLTHAEGNVVGTPVDRLVAPDNNPLGLRHQLEPGERLALWQRFSTMHDGSTRSKVEIIVQGTISDPEAPSGERLVMASETIVRDINGEPATERHVVVDVEDPVAYSSWHWTELGWIFTDSTARGFGRWVDSTWELAQLATSAGYHLSLAPWYAITFTYRMMSEAERDAVAQQVASYYESITDLSPSQAKAAVDAAITAKIVNATTAWETGDAPFFVSATGGLLGETVPDLVLEAGMAKAFAKLASQRHGWQAMKKVDDAQRASLATRVAAKGRKGFEPGDSVNPDMAFKWWGMDAAFDARIRAYVKKKGIVIAMRDRSPGSVAKLAQGLLGKIEKIKAKNVNDLDVKWLGFAESHLDTAMYKRMKDWSFYEQRLIDRGIVAGSEEYVRIHARWAQRTKEFAKEHPDMVKYAVKGKLPTPPKAIGMNVVDNGYPELKDAPWESTDFQLADSSQPGSGLDAAWDGEPAYQPRVMHEGDGHPKSFRAFTGDMDMIAILDQKGKILSKARRLEVYRELAELGFEHPESLTWDNIAGRAGYVADYDIQVANSDVLLGYMADGSRRAFKLDSKKSITEDPKYNFLMLHGMTADWDAPEPTENVYPPLPTLVSQVSLGNSEIEVEPYMGAPGDDRADYDNRDPDAPLLRETWDGSFQRFDQNTNTWVPFTPPSSGPVSQLPQTSLTASVDAGDTHVPIIEPDVLGAGGSGQYWFQPGDTVVFDPGGPNQEVHTVQALGSIITSRPLAKDHVAGEIVGILPGSIPRATTPEPPAPTPPIVTTKPDDSKPAGPKPIKPRSTKPVTVTGPHRVAGRLRCMPGRWSGTAPIRYRYTWQRQVKRKWVAIPRATKSTWTVSKSAAGWKVRCTVRATNTAGFAVRSSVPKSIPKPVKRRR